MRASALQVLWNKEAAISSPLTLQLVHVNAEVQNS